VALDSFRVRLSIVLAADTQRANIIKDILFTHKTKWS